MNARNILVVCPDRHTLAELIPLVSQHLPLTPVIEVTHYPDRKAITELVNSKAPTLCFLDFASEMDQAMAVMSGLNALSPATQVIALLPQSQPDLILTCLRQGATEFLLRPLSSEQLHPVLERLSHLNASQDAEGGSGAKVITVIPVKGASGASTIAYNLAFQWKKATGRKILLCDMDPATGTVSFLLKLKSSYSFLDALSRAGTLDSDLWKGLVSDVHGVDVLLAPENPTDATQDLPDPSSVIEFCRQAYDMVILDAGNAYSNWSLSLAGVSDEVLLVATNELPALRAAQRVLQHLDRSRVERSKVRLVINRYNTDAGLNQEAIETALHVDVYHVIPSDYESVQKALVEGKPISHSSGFGKSLIALADRLAGKRSSPEPDKKKAASWTSLFRSSREARDPGAS